MRKKGNKRKVNVKDVKNEELAVEERSQLDIDQKVKLRDVEHEEYLKIIKENDEDSTDSEAEYEESDEELDEVLYDNTDDDDEDDDDEGADDDDTEDDDDEESDDTEEDDDDEDDEESKSSEPMQKNVDKINQKNIDVTNEKNDESIVNEYEENDTSDEEDVRNTVGNVPKNWYDEYKHLGYDWDGKRILKPLQGDCLDEFLKRVEDPDFWRTVKDPETGQDVVLTEDDINLIKRINEQKIPDATFDEYTPWIEWFTNEAMSMPIRKFPEHKRSFLPSKSEAAKVSRLVHALKMGWTKTRDEQQRDRRRLREQDTEFYMLWSTDDKPEEMRRINKHIPAPKRRLPGHSESYNPPPEYLFDAKELKQWDKLKETPWKRKLHFVPQKYASLRAVPSYNRYVRERFLRCLDLYLCPRAIKMKLNIDPEELVPKLPSPNDLRPFPTVNSIEYVGHSDMIRTISVDGSGQYLASGSDDRTVKVWEVLTGRLLKTFDVEDVVKSVEWCPNAAISLILVAAGTKVVLLNPNVGDLRVAEKTDRLLSRQPTSEVIASDRVRSTVQWEVIDLSSGDYERSLRIVLRHFKDVAQIVWHGKGDYFASVMPDGQNRAVLISQLSKRRSQLPFNRSKGLVQCVRFHPIKPFLFVATQRHVRIYDLIGQVLTKKLMTNSKWISSMDVHPNGDNLLVGTYDRKMLWFDLDLSTKPYQTLRLHGTAVRAVAYHKRYPLFASCSDDRSAIVSHGMVYNDLLKNPLIVPLKRLQDHQSYNDFGCFDVLFHPTQPWLFTSGADSKVILYCN